MALIKCTEPGCNKEFSEYASACPSCGCPIEVIRDARDTMRAIQDAEEKKANLFIENIKNNDGISVFAWQQNDNTETVHLLGFYSDSTVIYNSFTLKASESLELECALVYVAEWFNKNRSGIGIGRYLISGSKISFSINHRNGWGSVDYRGIIAGAHTLVPLVLNGQEYLYVGFIKNKKFFNRLGIEMALIKCTEPGCNKEFSEHEPACPNCGSPIEVIRDTMEKNAVLFIENLRNNDGISVFAGSHNFGNALYGFYSDSTLTCYNTSRSLSEDLVLEDVAKMLDKDKADVNETYLISGSKIHISDGKSGELRDTGIIVNPHTFIVSGSAYHYVGFIKNKKFFKGASKNEIVLDLCKNAEAGSDEALYKLGAACENSADIEQNLEKAYKCYLLALKKGNKNAVRKVLEFTRADFKMRLADIDSEELLKELSEVDFSRFILPADDEKDYQTTRLSPDERSERLAKRQRAQEAEQIEQMADEQKLVAECFRLATDTEEQYGGNEYCQWNLGEYQYHGKYGLTKDQAEAVKWYLLAAVQGHSEARRRVGRAFERGEGVKPDLTEAFKWYRLAGEQGNYEDQERRRSLEAKLQQIMKKYDFGDSKLFFYPSIPEEKLSSAIAAYAKNESSSDALVLLDETVFGSGKDGLLLTRNGLFSHELFSDPLFTRLEDIDSIWVKDKNLYINKTKCLACSYLSRQYLPMLSSLLLELVVALREAGGGPSHETEDERPTSSETPPLQAQKPDSSAKTEDMTEDATPSPVGSKTIGGDKIMAILNKYSFNDEDIYFAPEIPEKKLKNAINAYAPGLKSDDVLLLLDDTLMGGAKEGALLSRGSIFFHELFSDPVTVKFSDIKDVSVKDTSIVVNGKPVFKAVLFDKKYLGAFAKMLGDIAKECAAATP